MKRIPVPPASRFQPVPTAPQPRRIPPGVSEQGQLGQVNKNVVPAGGASKPGAK